MHNPVRFWQYNDEEKAVGALFDLMVSYGGDAKVDAVNKHIRDSFNRAHDLLVELGYYRPLGTWEYPDGQRGFDIDKHGPQPPWR
tara:strand:- start:1508 stop:1762 length:255 start_codon:yes stop_codon:yes gene_type:complete